MAEPTLTVEDKPPAVDTDGNFLVLFVPKGGIADVNHPTVSELTANTVKKGTYSMSADGWAFSRDQATGTDDRLTLPQTFVTLGRVTDSLEITYVFGTDEDVLDPLLVAGWEGYVVPRYAIPNEAPLTAGQKVTVIPVIAGVKRVNPPATNEKWTKTQTLAVSAPGTQDDVEIAAS